MKLVIMTFEAINYIKNNLSNCLDHYKNADKPEEWLKDRLGKQPFVEVPELEFDDFELLISEDAPSSTDIQNIKLLYGKMSEINDSFAADERLWAGLAHTVFYDYMLKRWPGKCDEKSILNHFFFAGSRPRCYMVNSISKLWWIGKKTISLDAQNPYEILDFMSHDINGYGFTLFGSNWSNSERTLRLFFDAVFSFIHDTGETIGRELFNDAIQYTNCLCGVYILDACDDDFVREKIKSFLAFRNNERKEELEYNRLNNIKTTGIEKLDNIIKAINEIGGHGSTTQITIAYQNVSQKKNTEKTIKYIKRMLSTCCPDVKEYSPSNNPIFYRITIDDKKVWKVSNEYLCKANRSKRKALIDRQIDSLSREENIVFNTVNAINSMRISIEDLKQFKSALAAVHSDISDLDLLITNGVKCLRDKGLLELIDVKEQIYKKSYQFKID